MHWILYIFIVIAVGGPRDGLPTVYAEKKVPVKSLRYNIVQKVYK